MTAVEREELMRLRRENKQLRIEREILGEGYGLVRSQRRQDVHAVFELVNANQAELPVRTMCRVLGVSASGFYDWLQRPPSKRAIDDEVLVERIVAVHAESRETYGRLRIRAELAEQGTRVGGKRVARLMRHIGIQGISKRRAFVVTTRRDQRERPAPDLVQRGFKADRPDALWVADMTYVPTWAGFVYLAAVMDVFSRRIVGWAMGENMTSDLVLRALNMGLEQRRPSQVIHHSDQGSQYTSLAFGKRCAEMGVRASVGSVGDAYDNAMAESFFATLECELLERRSFQTKTEARAALFSYIEGWYNPRRRHSALGYLSPIEFERRQTERPPTPSPLDGLPTAGACVAGATPAVDNPAPARLQPPHRLPTPA